jgi:hypothetical protein
VTCNGVKSCIEGCLMIESVNGGLATVCDWLEVDVLSWFFDVCFFEFFWLAIVDSILGEMRIDMRDFSFDLTYKIS